MFIGRRLRILPELRKLKCLARFTRGLFGGILFRRRRSCWLVIDLHGTLENIRTNNKDK